MKAQIIIPAIASLALLGAYPASAKTLAPNAPWGVQVQQSPGGMTLASLSPAKYHCRTYSNRHERSRCREVSGIPDHMN
ncbi:hypothetical protein SAMN05444161_6385 [Rhizobiales bacterium GAS191]|jgi:hypothetical protein|nr:hypothetical protein SAMN05519103_05563 [Rhizobiales bacterium GAS113]SED88349.1 hypothetical protein SAMN05519104_4642 [Rhizobiales bacterium GAS188]SEE61421.1 hypothetical protein SAMN05444161_6385 [Rhizobiales bacterium GAS191]